MLTGKQRAYLRGLANSLTPIFQIGKNGVEENFLIQVSQALEARELIKIKVLENSGLDSRETSRVINTSFNNTPSAKDESTAKSGSPELHAKLRDAMKVEVDTSELYEKYKKLNALK